MEQKRLFSGTDLRKLMIPLILEQALAITVGMADTMMVSSVGEAAISGVSLVDMINNLIFAILAALATGGSVVTSQFIGAGRDKEAKGSAKQLLWSLAAFSAIMMAASMLLRKQLMMLFFGGIEQDVMDAGLTYLLITAVSFPFLGVYNACSALFRAQGNSRITLKISIWTNIINVAGNAICIYVLKMGVAGVAVPSLVSRAFAAVTLYILLKNPSLLVYFDKERFKPDWKMIRRILTIGIPNGVENGIFQLGRILVVSIISGFGTVQIAANGVANNIDSVGIIIGQGVGLGLITVIGQCVGAQDEKQIRYYTKRIMAYTYLATAVLNGLIIVGCPFLLSLYSLSEETKALTTTLIMLHSAFAIIFWPMAFTFPNVLRACNDVNYTMFASMGSMIVFRIGLSYIIGVHYEMGIIGVWIAMIVDWVFRSSFFLIRYLSGGWKKLAFRKL